METSGQTTSAVESQNHSGDKDALDLHFSRMGFYEYLGICEGTNYPRLKWQIPKTDWVCPDGVELEDMVYLAGKWMENPWIVRRMPMGRAVDLQDFEILASEWMLE